MRAKLPRDAEARRLVQQKSSREAAAATGPRAAATAMAASTALQQTRHRCSRLLRRCWRGNRGRMSLASLRRCAGRPASITGSDTLQSCFLRRVARLSCIACMQHCVRGPSCRGGMIRGGMICKACKPADMHAAALCHHARGSSCLTLAWDMRPPPQFAGRPWSTAHFYGLQAELLFDATARGAALLRQRQTYARKADAPETCRRLLLRATVLLGKVRSRAFRPASVPPHPDAASTIHAQFWGRPQAAADLSTVYCIACDPLRLRSCGSVRQTSGRHISTSACSACTDCSRTCDISGCGGAGRA